MKKGGGLEFLTGSIILFCVFFGIGYIYLQRYQDQDSRAIYGAEFDSVGSLMIGSPVKINGACVGEVTQISLNPKTNFTVFVRFYVRRSLPLPSDTSALIENESLLGSPTLSLIPGNSEVPLSTGETIYETRSPTSFGQLIERFLFSGKESITDTHHTHKDQEEKTEEAPSPPEDLAPPAEEGRVKENSSKEAKKF